LHSFCKSAAVAVCMRSHHRALGVSAQWLLLPKNSTSSNYKIWN
jgi:hypothetical protein